MNYVKLINKKMKFGYRKKINEKKIGNKGKRKIEKKFLSVYLFM